jgi:hypothetical protein
MMATAPPHQRPLTAAAGRQLHHLIAAIAETSWPDSVGASNRVRRFPDRRSTIAKSAVRLVTPPGRGERWPARGEEIVGSRMSG